MVMKNTFLEGCGPNCANRRTIRFGYICFKAPLSHFKGLFTYRKARAFALRSSNRFGMYVGGRRPTMHLRTVFDISQKYY